ncbi:MAG TPA: M6 family metalloprotease domain-containing protein [Candidatus Cloacimonadota bacterium]|nr:M6 family metalloprotease domain-containing protein [Candidatus Cloacimonadota bacterium]HQL15446.1 M6 family metalloprotease domain-containing protein [Candidatus Cloacimonadota bacterium]
MRFKSALAILLFFGGSLFAARVMNHPVTLVQPDGTILEELASGDEFHNWLHDGRNYTIIQDKQTGWYTWAVRNGENLTASNYIVGQTDPAEIGLEPGLNLTQEQLRERYLAFAATHPQPVQHRIIHTGTLNNLVIFIKFSNSPDFTHPLSYYADMFNTDTAGYNSMRNFFQAASYNQLDIVSQFYPLPNGNTIVCYVDSHPRQYYMPLSATNPQGYDENDDDERALREFTLLTNAASFVSSQIPSTLDLDGDDDGYIDNICFIVQGNTTAWATLLWPHRWAVYNSTTYINGALVYDFNFQLESFLDNSGTSVLCHEMTHSLGAPDLYRYYNDTIDPIGSWDLMCGNANPPQSMAVWLKYKYLGWVANAPILTQSGTYSLRSVWSQNNNIYRIPSWRSSEYYVLEYRKPFDIYDGNIPGTGLLIYRLNINEDGNADGPPDELYIYRPEGVNNVTDGNLNQAHWSLQTGRTFMNETTVPSGFLSDNAPGGLDISDISFAGGDTMTFHVNISNVQVTYPKGGETFFGNAVLTVTWKAKTAYGSVKIEYSANNGQTWQTVTSSAPNTGSYNWQSLPIIDSNQCLVRVTTLTNGAVDVCNAPFTILSTIGVPVPLFPYNMMQNAPTNPTFRWSSVSGAESYTLQVALDSLFVANILNLIDLPDTTYTYNNLMPFTTYYWQVAAYATIGLSDSSPVQRFTTGDISILPGVPVLISPSMGAINQPRNELLRWNSASYAYRYHYQVATDSYFTNIVQEDDSLQATQIRLQPLEANTRYFWRVRAANSAGHSNFSNIRNFTTGDYVTANNDEVSSGVFSLAQNQPNPFRTKTRIDFRVQKPAQEIKLTIYNLKGQVVKTLAEGKAKSLNNSVEWDGCDADGHPVSSGVYYYRLETGYQTLTRKLVLIR